MILWGLFNGSFPFRVHKSSKALFFSAGFHRMSGSGFKGRKVSTAWVFSFRGHFHIEDLEFGDVGLRA